MSNQEAITYIKKEVPDFETYPLQEREIVIAAFKMGWHCKERHDLQLIVSVSQSTQAPAYSPSNSLAAGSTKSGAFRSVKERVGV